MAQIPSVGGGGPSGGSGWVKITDMDVPGGSATNKVYQDGPNNTILQSVTVSALSVDVTVKSSYPIVDIDGNLTTLPQASDGGHYEDNVSIVLASGGTLVVTAQTGNNVPGAGDSLAVTYTPPAQFTSLLFSGSYPGAQTELKAGDTFQLAWTTDNPIDAIQTTDFGALDPELITFASATSGTVTVTIADRGTILQSVSGRAQPRDAVSGALGTERDTNLGGGGVDGVNVLWIDNTYPTLVFGSPSYPGIQQALKGSETATIAITRVNLDTIVYDSPNGDLSITNPTTDEATKTVTRIAGSYNITVQNFRGVATRAANAAVTTTQAVVNIANAAVVITVAPATARVRSGPSPGNDTVITISGDQQLLEAPALDPAVGFGTFQGGGFVGGPVSWTRSLRVPDSENPATGAAQTWLNLVATNLAGTITNAITTGSTYVVGGFTARTLNYPAYTANSTEDFPLTDESKLDAGAFSNGNTAIVQPFGTADTSDDGKEGWCAPTAATGVAVNMRMLHIPTVGANAAGLTLTLVEETV